MTSSSELKICEYNVENLFISMEYYEGEDLSRLTEEGWRQFALPQLRARQKPLTKLWGLAEAIEEIAPDILMLIEVGGKDSLENFNRHFLADRFIPFFVEGNSRRAIDLGFLIKRDLRYRTQVSSNRDLPVEITTLQGRTVSRFSRDVAELRLFGPSDARTPEELKLILLLTHLKSKLSTEMDVQGKDVRTAEAFALTDLYRRRRGEFPGVPVILGGDFNADLSSQELELLTRTDLIDVHAELGTAPEERFTLVHFFPAGVASPVTLDYLLISPDLKNRIIPSKSYVFRYKGLHGIELDAPRTVQQRYQMPSDHYPVVLTIELDRV